MVHNRLKSFDFHIGLKTVVFFLGGGGRGGRGVGDDSPCV